LWVGCEGGVFVKN